MRKDDTRQELNIYDLCEKTNEYQQNYYKHILGTPTDQIPWKRLSYNPEGRR